MYHFFQLLQGVVLSAFNVVQQKINENQREFGPWTSIHKTGMLEIKYINPRSIIPYA